jgi:hypothetical protein
MMIRVRDRPISLSNTMKIQLFLFIMLLAAAVPAAIPQHPQGPMNKNQVMALVKAGMQTPELVKLIHEHGIDFDLTDDYLQSLRKAGAQEPVIQALRAARPKPLNKEQVLQLVVGDVPSQRAVALVKEHGIDFQLDEEYIQTLRLAGADETLIGTVRLASQGQLVVVTSPNASVYLDGGLQGGHANAQGELTMKSEFGTHKLKVTLAGKKDFERSITLAAQQVTRIEARLEDLRVVTVDSSTAHTHNELIVLAHITDRDYFEFSLPYGRAQQRVGTVTVELEGTDTNRNVFSVYLYGDDKRIERKDKVMNDHVYFYVQGAASALELVVNKLGKDSISGYIDTPKGFFPNTPNVLTMQSGLGQGLKDRLP